VLIEHGGVRLLTDPVLRGRIMHIRRHGPVPETPESVDAVLVSHLHYDHLDLPSLRKIGTQVRVIVSCGAGAYLRKAGFVAVDELQAGESTAVEAVSVTATPAEHDSRRRPLGPSAEPLGFVSRTSKHSVYFAGDTDVFAAMDEIGPVDVALLPVAGWGPKVPAGHLNPQSAARAAALIRPRVVIPIHWGTLHSARVGSWFRDPPHAFAAHVAEVAPEVEVRVLAPGESLEL
jgi:L-ascorbate metabolism protein UlaG (beta-lactamase superfamily)